MASPSRETSPGPSGAARTGRLVVIEPPDWSGLAPLTLTRPCCGVRVGTGTLLDSQVASHRPARVTLWTRPGLEHAACRLAEETAGRWGIAVDVNQPLEGEEAVLIDGRTWWPDDETDAGDADAGGVTLRRRVSGVSGMTVPGAAEAGTLPSPGAGGQGPGAGSGSGGDCRAELLRHWWEVVALNRRALEADAARFPGRPLERAPVGCRLIARERIFAAGDVDLRPGCVLDASAGAIMLEAGVVIGFNSVISGPAYIGRDSQVLPLSRLGGGASVGPVCKVAGELGNCIFHGWSNKAHDGFLGDTYVGEWVNLGAGTITSNLKNTYGRIRAAMPGGRVDTGLQFVGSVIGDLARCGIGTMLPAGAYIGVGSQLALTRPGQFTPSFRFVTERSDQEADLPRIAAGAARSRARRKVKFGDADAELLRQAKETAERIGA